MLKYNRELEKYYIVVIWEQRGSGKSYYPFEKKDDININMFIEDIYVLTKYLLNRFNQSKLYLVGHKGFAFCYRLSGKV